MADINQEQKYLLYGQDEISQQDLMTELANDLPTYLNSKRWLQNPKYRDKWMTAYQDIINHGITGASSESGQWKIKYNGDRIDTDSMSNIDKEIYADAAWYIQNKMSQITPRKKEEEVKKELEPFDFKTSFGKQLLNLYGGDSSIFSDSEQGWNSLDARGNDGLRGTKERRRVMAKQLELYKKDLEGKDYNFEGTSFKDKNDALTKLQAAIDALGTDEESDDLPAFSALGLNYRNFFSNGGNEYTNNINPQTGNPYTYSQWNQIQKQQAEDKVKQATALKEANYANQYKNYKYYNYLNGTPANQEDFNNIALKLANNQQLDGNDISRISWAFRQAEKSGGLQNLSKEELQWMPRYANNPSRLKKINGLDGIYYDSIARRIVQPQRELNSNGVTLQSILDQNSPEALKEKQNKQSAINMNTPLSQMTEWTPEMKKEIEAIAWDAASILNPEAFSGSAMALYASHLRDEANPNRGTLEKWFDRGTAALGGIQGVGDLLVTGKLGYRLYQLGKSIGSVSKFAGIVGAGFGAIGAYEAKDSIAKLANPDSLTPKDLENIAYGLMGLIGLKSFAKARNKQTIGKQANPTITEHNITIKDKNNKTHEIKVDETTAKEIQQVRTLGKKKETVDSEILNMPKIKESIQKYKEANPTKKLEIEGASIVNDSKSAFGISGRNKLITSNQVKNPNAPEYVPVGTKRYNPFGYIAQGNNKWGYYLGGGWQRKAWENATPEQSSKGLWQKAKEFWNPEPKVKNETSSTETSNSIEAPKTAETSVPKSTEISKQSKERIKKYNESVEKRIKDLNEGKFSKNKLQSGDLDIAGHRLQVVEQSDGTFNLIYKGNIQGNFQRHEQKKLQETIREIINNRTVRVDSNTKIKSIGTKEIGKILQELKKKGWLKQGGQINSSLDTIIEDFIKNNNI